MEKSLAKKIREEFYELKEDITEIVEGYKFGRYLAKDVKQRIRLIENGFSSPLNNVSLSMQLLEYELAWGDVRSGEQNLHSAGIVIYGLLHRKEDKLMDKLWTSTVLKE